MDENQNNPYNVQVNISQPQPQPGYQQPVYTAPQAAQPPANQLKTDRTLTKFILLSLVTFGIYSIVAMCKMANEINTTATRADGKHTMHYIPALLLGSITCGIYTLVWMHKFCERVGDEANRRNTGVEFGATDFWIFGVLLSFTIVCPFIFYNKLLNATNMINKSSTFMADCRLFF